MLERQRAIKRKQQNDQNVEPIGDAKKQIKKNKKQAIASPNYRTTPLEEDKIIPSKAVFFSSSSSEDESESESDSDSAPILQAVHQENIPKTYRLLMNY
jgi:hypothetical protein